MNPGFNLTEEVWIPCLFDNGEVFELSLRQVFEQAHEVVDIAADSPMENAALYRFLLTILHRNFGPANSQKWRALWEAKTFPIATLNGYFDEWYERFDLFSAEFPFAQFKEDSRVQPKSVVSLKHGFGMLPSSWFDHQASSSNSEAVHITPAEAARALLTVLAFGFGGLSGIPRVSHTDAFCTKGVIFIVQGDTLKQTLLLNLNRYEFDPIADEPDMPSWEMDDPLELERSEPLGLLDHLTFPSRSMMLYLAPDKLEQAVAKYRLGIGLRADSAIRDPMKHYYESKSSGFLPLAFDEDRQLWRNSYSLIESNQTGKHPPQIFTWLNVLVETGALPRGRLFQCKALGIAKNQGRADFARQEQFPLPASLLADENKLALLKDAIDGAERSSWVLSCNLALTGMYLHLNNPIDYNWARYKILHGGEKDLRQLKSTQGEIEDWIKYTGAERHYWAALDIPFLLFMQQLGQASAGELQSDKAWWQQQVRKSADSAFRQVMQYTNQSPRAFKAFAQGNNRLQGYLHKNFPLQEKTV